MANGSALPEQTDPIADDDLVVAYVDVSDTSAAETGTNKWFSFAALLAWWKAKFASETEISDALSDSDSLLVLDASDTTQGPSGTVKRTLLSRIKTWLFASTDIGEALADGDTIVVTNASASGAVRVSAVSRIYDYLLAKVPIAWGAWTPTLTGTINIDAVTWTSGYYLRVGSLAVGFGQLTQDATSTGATEFEATTPVATNFSNTAEAWGLMSGANISAGRVNSNGTSDRLRCSSTAVSASSGTVFMIVGMQVIS